MVATPINLMIHSATVQRRTETADTGGSPINTFGTHLTGVAGRLQPASASEQILYGSERGVISHSFYTAGGQDILEGDRLVIVANGTTITIDVDGHVDFDRMGVLSRIDGVEVKPL